MVTTSFWLLQEFLCFRNLMTASNYFIIMDEFFHQIFRSFIVSHGLKVVSLFHIEFNFWVYISLGPGAA